MIFSHSFHVHTAEAGYLSGFDPRSKILTIFILVITIFTLSVKQPRQVILMTIVAAVFIMMSRREFLSHLQALLRILPMMIMITLILPFRPVPGSIELPVATWGGLSVFQSGIERFMEINIKFVLLVSASLTLLSTTSIQHLLQGMESMRLPSWLGAILYFMVYFLFVLNDELSRQYLAFKSRYIYLSPWKRIRLAGKMAAVYFIRIIERSERATMAMISRGFTGKIHSIRTATWRMSDTVLVLLTLTIVLSIKVLF